MYYLKYQIEVVGKIMLCVFLMYEIKINKVIDDSLLNLFNAETIDNITLLFVLSYEIFIDPLQRLHSYFILHLSYILIAFRVLIVRITVIVSAMNTLSLDSLSLTLFHWSTGECTKQCWIAPHCVLFLYEPEER